MARRRRSVHTLERQAGMLATASRQWMKVVSRAITPPGGRPPFTTEQSPAEILAFWAAHRYDATGKKILASMTPLQVAELDTWLSQALPHPAAAGVTAQRPPQLPGGQTILNRAISAERRIEGAPVGSEVS